MPPKKDPLVSIGAPSFREIKRKGRATYGPEDVDLELGSKKECIYEVPKNIRQGNEKAYTPLLISIGPLHYRKKILANRNKDKLRYQKKFCMRTSEKTLVDFWEFIEQKETEIRSSYEALIDEDEFVRMIFYDAIFIVELFLSKYDKEKGENRETKDYLLNETSSATLRRDLILLENQIPWFVLEELYNLYCEFTRKNEACPCASAPSALPFLRHACIYFDIPWDNEKFKDKDIRHFTDLQRCHLVKKHPPVPSEIPAQLETLLYSATTLNGDAGVELTVVADRNACLLDIELEEKVLKIPRLTLHSNTEAYIRNVMAFEMCHNPDEAYVCAYVELMNNLMKTYKDVDLLIKKQVLSVEGKKDGRVVSKINLSKTMVGMMKKLMQGVGDPPDCYLKTGDKLNKLYQDSRKNKVAIILKENLASLKRVYFPNLLRATVSLAALMVVVLTLMQTVLAFLK